MRHNLWDRMMYRLLQEKKEKEVKVGKSKGSKPDFLDLDKDGDKEEPMSKASKESGGKKDAPKAKKGKGKIPPQLRMHIQKKKKKSKLDEAIEKLERILINEGNYGNPVEPGTIEVGINFGSSLVNDFTKRYGEWGGKKYEQEIKQMADKLSNFVNYDMDETREGQYVSIRTDDTEKAINFIQNAIDKKDELFNLGVGEYSFIFLKGDQVKNKNGEPLKQGEAIKFGIKDLEKLSSLEDLFVSEEDGEISAPGAIGGGQVQMAESLKRLEKLLEQYLSVREITEDQADDDDFGDDDEERFKDGSCPECGYSGFDGEVCDNCGYDKTDDDLEESVEYLSEAEVKKKQPRLGKVTRNPAGSKKKFHVYVKCGGRVKKISFGDPGLSIKRDSASRRKNFRARHKCDKPAGKDRCTARYWSCYQWRAGKKVEGEE